VPVKKAKKKEKTIEDFAILASNLPDNEPEEF
jgi:hypothetical protein